MITSNEIKSIHELNIYELANLQCDGHLGNATKRIAELQTFYKNVDDEILRRELKMKETQKILPIDKYFTVKADSYTLYFKVLDCKECTVENNITHYVHVNGFMVHNGRVKKFDNGNKRNYQIDNDYIFGWNKYSQKMIFGIVNNFSFYEVNEINKDIYNKAYTFLYNIGLFK